jgi:hypothetical protein
MDTIVVAYSIKVESRPTSLDTQHNRLPAAPDACASHKSASSIAHKLPQSSYCSRCSCASAIFWQLAWVQVLVACQVLLHKHMFKQQQQQQWVFAGGA